jgi:hypothetical protein
LSAQAPYWDAIKDIESRYTHATISSLAQEYTPENFEATHDLQKERGHVPLLGFSDVKIIRDTRFRLVEALRMAGVQHSQAAKEVVARYHPRPHLAIHGIFG